MRKLLTTLRVGNVRLMSPIMDQREQCHSKNNNEVVRVHVVDKLGNKKTLEATAGTSVLELSRKYDLGLEGACEASVACSTCHVYIDKTSFETLPEATEEEEDMLEMAPQLTELSRLGCQVLITKELEGMTISFPSVTRNFYVDGHTPHHH